MSARLTAAADGVSKQLESITEKYDGSTMAGLDSLIPGPDKYKGTAREAAELNIAGSQRPQPEPA